MIIGIAYVLHEQGKFEESVEIIKNAISSQPDSPALLNYLGYMYADNNIHLDEAEILIDKALKKEPENYAYIDSKAWVLYKKGKYKEAYKYIQKAYEKSAKDPEVMEHYNIIAEKIK